MSSTAGTGVETLQMIMKTQPLSNREVQMVIGDSKTPAETTQEDIKRRADAPEIHVPADAPADFDINQLLVQSHGEDEDYIELEAEDLYEDMDEVFEDSEEKIIEERSAVYPKHHGKER